LQGAEKFSLQGQRHITDLVKKQRTPVRRLEEALPVFVGPSKSACHIPEEFAFEQAFREAATVDGHEGPAGATATLVDGTGEQFLAGAWRMARLAPRMPANAWGWAGG
jgi:hypothetical protein